VRHALLGLLAAFVVIAGVYLFREVRSTPSAVAASSSPQRDSPPAERAEQVDHTLTPSTDRPATVPHQPPTTAPSTPPTMASEPAPDEDPAVALERPDVKVDAIMARANAAYDKGDWDEAKTIAGKVLTKQPTNNRMMRIMVSASCIDGDSVTAQQWYERLPKGDRDQMKTRCDRYGISFKEPAQ
jgi:cytoskeletal protein RodZ